MPICISIEHGTNDRWITCSLHGDPHRQADRRHRRPHRRIAGIRGGEAGAGAGRRRRVDRCRAGDWMGVAKAALESTSRYLARELGSRRVRVNTVAAGPVRTMAAKSIPGFSRFEDAWADRAPLGWDVNDSSAVAKACVALLSD